MKDDHTGVIKDRIDPIQLAWESTNKARFPEHLKQDMRTWHATRDKINGRFNRSPDK